MAVVSSCRDVGLKSCNERNLINSCQHSVGHLVRLPVTNWRKGGDDVKSSCPYDLGYTRYNGVYNELPTREGP